MCNARIVPCEACGTEGRLVVASQQDWHTGEWMDETEPCPYCEGTGGELIETQPITLEDLEELYGEAHQNATENPQRDG